MDAPVQTAPRHFLGLLDLSASELRRILDMSAAMKKARVKGVASRARPLAGKTLAMVFDRPSTRTRVSFDVAMRELGGETIMLTGADMLTFEEKRGPIRGRKIAWSGDYNNVLSSWIDASARFGFALDIACPRELRPTEQR